MYVKDILATVPGVKAAAVQAGGFLRRRKRLTVAVVVAALLLTGDGELFVLNAVGLGLGALLLRRFTSPRGRQRTGRGQQAQWQQATRAQQTAKATQQGGNNDDASDGDWWDWDKAAAKPAGRPADGGAVQG